MYKVRDINEDVVHYVEHMKHKPFEWGYNDCVLFALRFAQLHSEYNILEELPPWSDENSANSAIETLGKDLKEAAYKFLPTVGMKIKPPILAKYGDIIVVSTPRGYMLTLCLGTTLAAPGDEGVVFLKRRDYREYTAWEIK